ncbi:hypothetical protein C8A03DRAFT_29928 [Achaetomium macrosporum]|uniref:Uncharacterized protein n=1 Tax=Achaetomium macrosporum TaxID=79813 RepID=A0AAN7CJD2_9PEZI|nr:hypothetical protein C8A03DRAFT_29928 [Achaetomium macrosporum]
MDLFTLQPLQGFLPGWRLPGDISGANVRDFLNEGNAIFLLAIKSGAGGNSDEIAQVILSQNGSIPYTVELSDGETLELCLVSNRNAWRIFWSGRAPEEWAILTTIPITPGSALGFRKLFCLTEPRGGLGTLVGPAIWAFEFGLDGWSDTLLIAATGVHRDTLEPIRDTQLRVPLWVRREWLGAEGPPAWRSTPVLRLYVDWARMEQRIPGVHTHQAGLLGLLILRGGPIRPLWSTARWLGATQVPQPPRVPDKGP